MELALVKHNNGSIGVCLGHKNTKFFDKFYPKGHGIESIPVRWLYGKLVKNDLVKIEVVINDTIYYKPQARLMNESELTPQIKDALLAINSNLLNN